MYFALHQLTASSFFFSLLLASVSFGQTTERVNVDSLGAEGNGGGYSSSISADGRYVAFKSSANNLVPGDWNQQDDIFVHDRQTGVTERVSVDSLGVQGNSESWAPAISANGRYVAFGSWADNLVFGDTNGWPDIFVHDRQIGVTERVSVDSLGVEGSNSSWNPAISADGRYVAFGSWADNLVSGDTNGKYDTFVHDRQSGVTERVSVDSLGVEGNSSSYRPSISASGRFVAFVSWADNLVSGDTNGKHDIFVHDRRTGVTERVSVDSLGAEGSNFSESPSISAGGRYVAFMSHASNLVPGDTNGTQDIFVHDCQSGVTERVSVDSLGVEGNGFSYRPSISTDGLHVVFQSSASNLVPGDTNGVLDVFVHDRQSAVTERVSVNSRGVSGDKGSTNPSISADGRYVAFSSVAPNLVPDDTNLADDIFVHNRWNGLGANSIYLTGPATALVGAPLNLSWFTARPNSDYWLAWSANTNGAVVGGHSIDIGAPQTVLATGTNSGSGMGSFSSIPIPPSAVGLTIHFEVVVRDAGGILYDSNALAVAFN